MVSRRKYLLSMSYLPLFFINSNSYGKFKINKKKIKPQGKTEVISLNILNENPLGISQSAKNSVTSDTITEANYSVCDREYKLLKREICKENSINESEIYIGPGLRYVIYELMLRFKMNGGVNSFVTIPDYGTTARFSKEVGLNTNRVEMTKEYTHPISALEKYNSEENLIYFSNPHLPYGSILSLIEMETFLKKNKKSLVVVDEAYIEYSKSFSVITFINLIKKYDNLVVLRTFSKIYGLSGQRIGYAVSNKKIIKKYFSNYHSIRLLPPLSTSMAKNSLRDKNFRNKTRNYIENQKKIFLKSIEKDEEIQHINGFGCYITFSIPMSESELFYKKQSNNLWSKYRFNYWLNKKRNTLEFYLSVVDSDHMKKEWILIKKVLREYKFI